MVGPSITADDRERFLRRLKIGFGLFVGLSMAMVTLYGGASLLIVGGVAVVASLVGGLLAEYTFPDSIAETPFEDSDTPGSGPKPGRRTIERRTAEEDDERRPAADGEGRTRRHERD